MSALIGPEEKKDGTKPESTGEDADAELEALKARVKQMEEEDERLRKLQEETEGGVTEGAGKGEADARSVYVGNVDYSTKPEELQSFFQSCGAVERVTILCDKWTGHPKGFAYIEFADKDSVANAILLNETLFKGRQLKVTAKRTNLPGMSARGGFRGGGFRGGRGGGWGAPAPYYFPRGGGRGAFRGRGRGFYHPYIA